MNRWAWIWLLVGSGWAVRDLARPGDPGGAEALWLNATEQSADPTASAYLPAARELRRIRPWQEGFDVARTRLATVENARLRPPR